MYEYRIQQAWESYREDFGLGRILLIIMFYNSILSLFSLVNFGKIHLLGILPIIISFVSFYFRPLIAQRSGVFKFIFMAIYAKVVIILNYYLIGQFDIMANGLTRLDALASAIDLFLFDKHVALIFENFLSPTGLIGSIIYDMMMLSYMLYYLLPIYGGAILYQELKSKNKYKISRYVASFVLFFLINFFCYLLVPITGPQFYWEQDFTTALPLTDFGQTLWQMVRDGQTTFIDCFPSGHTGIAILTNLWFFKINHHQRFLMSFIGLCIVSATLAMRFHYTIDLAMAIPLALVSYKLSGLVFPVSFDAHLQREQN